jgi:Ala-tRNA(Pro) deacylase
MYVRDYLQSRHVAFEMFLQRPAASASRRAQCMHVPGRRVAKSVLVRAGERYMLAVLPATARIDLNRLSQVLDGLPVRVATEDEVGRVFADCERGAIPPFGRLHGLTTILEVSLADGGEFVCVGNQRHEGLRLRFQDYEAIEAPLRARFADDPRPAPRRRAS